MNDKVLIVDDEVSILKGIKLNLGRNFNLTTASSPENPQRSRAKRTFRSSGLGYANARNGRGKDDARY